MDDDAASLQLLVLCDGVRLSIEPCQVQSRGSVIAFLASDDARWISGETIRVDGGSKL